MKNRSLVKCLVLICVALGMPLATAADDTTTDVRLQQPWKEQRPTLALQKLLRERLPTLGHRNWIVVVDMAYPLQSRAGIETIYLGGQQVSAVRQVLEAIDTAPHVQGKVHLDAELEHVPEADAPGITAYRDELQRLFEGRHVSRLPHEQLIEQLDAAAQTFHVLIIKTDMVIPYTSVFIELDCGYWNADKEARLREKMKMK